MVLPHLLFSHPMQQLMFHQLYHYRPQPCSLLIFRQLFYPSDLSSDYHLVNHPVLLISHPLHQPMFHQLYPHCRQPLSLLLLRRLFHHPHHHPSQAWNLQTHHSVILLICHLMLEFIFFSSIGWRANQRSYFSSIGFVNGPSFFQPSGCFYFPQFCLLFGILKSTATFWRTNLIYGNKQFVRKTWYPVFYLSQDPSYLQLNHFIPLPLQRANQCSYFSSIGFVNG